MDEVLLTFKVPQSRRYGTIIDRNFPGEALLGMALSTICYLVVPFSCLQSKNRNSRLKMERVFPDNGAKRIPVNVFFRKEQSDRKIPVSFNGADEQAMLLFFAAHLTFSVDVPYVAQISKAQITVNEGTDAVDHVQCALG
ncbi:uncharacterized protein ARMOST_02109 [Armillaria ostoyae]|uniref:Uncharacterized protein n=1 Tax=Armillaria ostoyae TaxID=47428 RepID=A0A284QQV2_ARMOS|nr:uncharacterized protein ARMOST_02109 [Armillaria ostoyae]